MSDLKILSIVRVMCGINLLFFQLFIILPNFTEIYSTSSFFQISFNTNIDSTYFTPSLLLLFGNTIRLIIFTVWVFLGIFLTYRVPNILFWILLIFLNSQFHNLNPLIVHEPQQILNFLILCLPLLRSNEYTLFELFKVNNKKNTHTDSNLEIGILNLFLGFYYFLAGIKKLPIKTWSEGYGLTEILAWNGIARPWVENYEIYFDNNSISKCLFISNYAIIAFELLFITIVFSRYKKILLPIGIVFHLINFILFDVGMFHLIMLSLYPVLFSKSNFKDFIHSLLLTFKNSYKTTNLKNKYKQEI